MVVNIQISLKGVTMIKPPLTQQKMDMENKAHNQDSSLRTYCLAVIILSLLTALTEFYFNRSSEDIMLNDVAAIVNENEIPMVDYLTAVAMIKEDKRASLTTDDYQLVIDRLIEEELLFQYGLNNAYIYKSDISKNIVDNMLANIISEITSTEKSDSETVNFYQMQMKSNPQFYQVMKDVSFNSIKSDLAMAMLEIEKNKAIQDYLTILKNKAQIEYREPPLQSGWINTQSLKSVNQGDK